MESAGKRVTLPSANLFALIGSSSCKTFTSKNPSKYISLSRTTLYREWSKLWIVLTDNVWITSGPIESKDFVTSLKSLSGPWYTTCPCFEVLRKRDINQLTTWSEHGIIFSVLHRLPFLLLLLGEVLFASRFLSCLFSVHDLRFFATPVVLVYTQHIYFTHSKKKKTKIVLWALRKIKKSAWAKINSKVKVTEKGECKYITHPSPSIVWAPIFTPGWREARWE